MFVGVGAIAGSLDQKRKAERGKRKETTGIRIERLISVGCSVVVASSRRELP